MFFADIFPCLFAVNMILCDFALYSMSRCLIFFNFFSGYFAPYSLLPYFKFGADWTKPRCFRNLVSSPGENHIMSIKTVLFSRISSFYWISSGKQLLLLSVPLLIAAKCFWILISCFSFSGSCRILLVIHSSKFLQLKFMYLTVLLIMLWNL